MATKTATMYVRIDPEVKERAESILASLGMTGAGAIDMFYRQIIMRRGLPFSVTIAPEYAPGPADAAKLSQQEFNALLDEGLEDVKTGQVRPADQVFAELAGKK